MTLIPRDRPLHRALPLVLALAGALLLGACAGIDSDDAGPTTTVTPVTLSATPPAGATDVAPDQPVTITAADGTLGTVTVAGPQGAVDGLLSADDTTWQSTSPLLPTTSYDVSVTTVDVAGGTAAHAWSFTTGAPDKLFRAILSPGDDKVVGVGMPVIVKLNTPIPKARHTELVKRLEVVATPAITGAWHWFSDTELHWRPATFWPAGTKVTVTAHIAGYAAPDGAYGAKDVTITYSIGAAHVSTVDVNAHTMTVTENGAVVRVIKVSTGRDEFPTHGGIHVASEKANPKIMDSSTIGIPRNSPGGYYESVPWSVRISNSGEFVHAASWSTAAQGNRNVSHGCVNVSPADGEWFYGFTQIGDVVQVNGSPVPLQPTNGIGDWQIPWAQWAN